MKAEKRRRREGKVGNRKRDQRQRESSKEIREAKNKTKKRHWKEILVALREKDKGEEKREERRFLTGEVVVESPVA